MTGAEIEKRSIDLMGETLGKQYSVLFREVAALPRFDVLRGVEQRAARSDVLVKPPAKTIHRLFPSGSSYLRLRISSDSSLRRCSAAI